MQGFSKLLISLVFVFDKSNDHISSLSKLITESGLPVSYFQECRFFSLTLGDFRRTMRNF